MKVFFYTQVHGSENYYTFYRMVYKSIEDLGYQHVCNILKDIDKNKVPRHIPKYNFSKMGDMYTNFIRHIKHADIIVVEISLHSFTSGFLMHEALMDGKPVIAMYLEGIDPYYMKNMNYERLQFVEYNSNNYKEMLKKAIETSKNQIDVRFNFFISPSIISYLNYISTELHISKSTYIRDLILKDIKNNKSYNRRS